MARPARYPLALALTGAALALAACGGEDAELLPGETAREITANLDTVQQLSDEGDCVGAESAAEQVGEQIEALEGVDPKLKRALEEGAARLEEVIVGCEESSEEAIAPATIPEPDEEDEAKPKKKDKDKEKGGGRQGEGAPDSAESAPEGQTRDEGEAQEGGGAPSGEEPPAEEQSGGVGPATPAGEGE